MSFGASSDCCVPCPTVTPPVSIPGSPGTPGTPGADGTDGNNAYGILAANMNVPPDTTTPVTISVDTSSWAVIGETIIIGQGVGGVLTNPGPAHFRVTAIPSAASIRLLWLNQTGDVVAGTQIDLGAVVSPSGQQGLSGAVTTTKGDMIADNGALTPSPSPQRLPVGANGRAIFADSAQALGVKYAGASQTLVVNTTASVNPNNNVENTLMSFSVPGNTLLNNGDSLEFECGFSCNAAASDKRVRVYFGATALLDLALVGAAAGGLLLIMRGRIYRTGAATQLFVGDWVSVNGAGTTNVTASTTVTPAENLAGAVLFKATGQLAIAAANQITQVSEILNYRAV